MLDMETIVIPLDHKPFGEYSIKKLFQNYEQLGHRLRFFEPAKFAYTHCTNVLCIAKQRCVLALYIQHKDTFFGKLMGLNRHVILNLRGVSTQSIRAMISYF